MQTTAITPSLIWQVSREGFGLGSFFPSATFDAVTEKVFFASLWNCCLNKLGNSGDRWHRHPSMVSEWNPATLDLCSQAGAVSTASRGHQQRQKTTKHETNPWKTFSSQWPFKQAQAPWGNGAWEQVGASGFPKQPAMLEQAVTPAQGQPATAVPAGGYNSVLVQGRKVVSGHTHSQALVCIAECSQGTQTRFLLVKIKQN